MNIEQLKVYLNNKSNLEFEKAKLFVNKPDAKSQYMAGRCTGISLAYQDVLSILNGEQILNC